MWYNSDRGSELYVRKSYNTLCSSVVGSSGLKITDQEIALLDLKTVLSVTALLHSNSVRNENAKSKKEAENFSCKITTDVCRMLEEYCKVSGLSKTAVV